MNSVDQIQIMSQCLTLVTMGLSVLVVKIQIMSQCSNYVACKWHIRVLTWPVRVNTVVPLQAANGLQLEPVVITTLLRGPTLPGENVIVNLSRVARVTNVSEKKSRKFGPELDLGVEPVPELVHHLGGKVHVHETLVNLLQGKNKVNFFVIRSSNVKQNSMYIQTVLVPLSYKSSFK